MLKYQVKSSSLTLRPANRNSRNGSSSASSSPCSISMHSLLDETLLLGIPTTSRSNSLLSLNSNDSNLSDASDVGVLKVDTRSVKQCTDYKTIRVTNSTTARQVVEKFLNTLKLTVRDVNLFDLWMELTTRASGSPVVTLLKLDPDARPYELQQCHPSGMSRFILLQNPTGFLVRVHDHNISPQSNYKSLLLSSQTTVIEAIHIVLTLNRKFDDVTKYGLFLSTPDGDAQIPDDVSLVSIARMCKIDQKIIIRNVDVF